MKGTHGEPCKEHITVSAVTDLFRCLFMAKVRLKTAKQISLDGQ